MISRPSGRSDNWNNCLKRHNQTFLQDQQTLFNEPKLKNIKYLSVIDFLFSVCPPIFDCFLHPCICLIFSGSSDGLVAIYDTKNSSGSPRHVSEVVGITSNSGGLSRASTSGMAIRVVEFSNGGYKIRKFFA